MTDKELKKQLKALPFSASKLSEMLTNGQSKQAVRFTGRDIPEKYRIILIDTILTFNALKKRHNLIR